ncbi:alpha/beta fold hydrolase [Gephyromycinifex aptenodytis]|uniref:alpha/beta fold hydrolase n=1 Tax=Gephyromycinifex aptenodytis TaxID=2716227 RepID=UPI001D01CC14|nr:alpha/beta hydrolase [Gephyromycinifex aptenodytis]
MSRLRLLESSAGSLEYLTVGSGLPHTVFGHGLAGSIPTTRPFGSGVPGSRTFFHFRGHGASHAPEDDWTYAALARELGAVADHVGADRALGVSMGAGALCALLAEEPQRFERCVFLLPALIDRPRTDGALERLVQMADYVDCGDEEAVADLLSAEQPEHVAARPDVQAWVRQQARVLAGTPVSWALRHLPTQVPLRDRGVLARVSAPVLVIGQEGDEAHPHRIAVELASAFPNAAVEILPPGGVLWTHRAHVRALISTFLGAH